MGGLPHVVPEVPALEPHFSSVSGSRFSRRNKSALFADRLQTRRKRRKTPEKDRCLKNRRIRAMCRMYDFSRIDL